MSNAVRDGSPPIPSRLPYGFGAGAADKTFVSIKGATHYYLGQPEHLKTCVDTAIDWSRRKGLVQ